MSRLPHLYVRGHSYTWRRRLPLPVAAIALRSHIARSLKTMDRSRARLLAMQLDLRFERAMSELMATWGTTPPTKEEVDAILSKFCAILLDEIETWAATRTSYAETQTFQDEEDFGRNGGDLIVDRHFSPASQQQFWEFNLQDGDLSQASERLKPLLAARGYIVDETSHEFRKLAYRATKAGIAVFRQATTTALAGLNDAEMANLLASNGPLSSSTVPPHAYPVAVPLSVASVQEPIGGPTLMAAFEDYIREKSQADWGGKSGREADTTMRLAIEYFGVDRSAATISRKEAKAFRTTLGLIPKLHGKGRFAGLGLHDAIAAADAIDEVIEDKGLPDEDANWPGLSDEGRVARLSLKTANKHLTYMKGVFDHIMDDDVRFQSNPFTGLLYAKTAVEKKVMCGYSGFLRFQTKA